MKTVKGICLPEQYYADREICLLVLNKFDGILFAGNQEGYKFYIRNKETLCKSLSLNGSIMDDQLRAYFDEPISTPNIDNRLDYLGPNFSGIIGESNPGNFPELIRRFPKCKITYTSYKTFLIRLFSCNIPNPFYSNQMQTWKETEKKYGKPIIKNGIELSIYDSPFGICWINILLNKDDIPTLTRWAIFNNKEVWYYAEPSMTREEIIKALGAL